MNNELENKDYLNYLKKISNLNEEENFVLEHYYGLNDNVGKTFKEIIPFYDVEFGSASASHLKNLRDNAIKKMKKVITTTQKAEMKI